jgi:CRISPR-associated protein Cmr3
VTLVRLALLPRDGWSCKDGRGWYTSDVGRSRSHPWPLPATLRGALRAAFGRDVMERTKTTLSPPEWEERSRGVAIDKLVTLCRPVGEPFTVAHRRWPVPADALYLDDESDVQRRHPRPRPADTGTLGPSDGPAVEALWLPRLQRGKPRPAPAFWTDDEMFAWLRGKPVAKRAPHDPERRVDVGLAINPATLAAQPTMLRSTEVTEGLSRDPTTKKAWEWAVGLEVALPEDAPGLERGPLFVGGRRRHAGVERIEPAIFDPPKGKLPSTKGLRLVLATPAELDQGWLPPGFEAREVGGAPVLAGTLPRVRGSVILRAAIVPRPIALSTWDMVQRAPRKTRLLVPAGSVYFFEKLEGSFTEDETHDLWLARLGDKHDEGLGLVLPGAWDPGGP